MVTSSVLGFPTIGKNREAKRALEAYWSGETNSVDVGGAMVALMKSTWATLKALNVDIIPGRQMNYHDNVAELIVYFGVIPPRYDGLRDKLAVIDLFGAVVHGKQSDGIDLPACEMKKWFDTNFHYTVPEISENTQFELSMDIITPEYMDATASGYALRPSFVGPLTFLYLSKPGEDAAPGFRPLSRYMELLPVYLELMESLKDAGAEWVQLEEPILVLDIADGLKKEFTEVYTALAAVAPKIMLATYFGSIGSTLGYVAKLPIAGLHIDLVQGADQLEPTLATLKSTSLVLSLGIVSGREVWKNEFAHSIKIGQRAIDELGQDRVQISTSCSLKHVPVTLETETKFTEEQRDWFAFATEKAREVAVITAALSESPPSWVSTALKENASSIARRRQALASVNKAIQDRVAAVTSAQLSRSSSFGRRKEVQTSRLSLPKFPTTTLGSYPQTAEIRAARGRYRKGQLSLQEYETFMKKEVESVIRFQERLGLDLLVHGEPERNDMVQYFGEQLHGFLCTENGWVQSCGTRYVRPPIIISDIYRERPMTVEWITYAQSLTEVPVKGMLTGPVTMLNWSFPRVDISRELQAKQIALALRDEVLDLEKAGIKVIQVDEPAIREGLPLKIADRDEYLRWAVASFKLATAGVKDETQIHSHFCYSDFGDIFAALQSLDADVISIEACKSGTKTLNAFKAHGYTNDLGPGVYDVHSPRIPTQEQIQERIEAMRAVIPDEQLFVNPDCGLKTRTWPEVEASLKNMVAAARKARSR